MFWDTTYSNSANIDALLNKEDCSLKELLEDEDILQECKTQNQRLVKFLNRPEVVDELVNLITTEPPADLDEKLRFLYPNVACEILTSDMPSLKQRMVEDPTIMNKLFSFFEQTTELNPLLASFICKTFGTLIVKKMEQDWFLYQTICLHVLEFIKSKDNFLECMVHHFSTPVIMDLLLTMLNEVEDAKMKSNFLEWMNENGLIERMIDVLRVPSESEKHIIVAQFLIEVIKTGRCNRQNDTEDRKSLPNPLLHRLEEPQTASRLIDVILCETRTESGILSGLQVLLCLLENSIIQEPVSQTALQQIINAEKEHHDEIIASLMSIIQPRVHQLFELLLNPPMKAKNYALTTSLGNVRLQLCNLFTVLLETENSSVIEEICKTNFFTELLNLFKQYCWNNFLHNYVKKCLVYGVEAFDTIPNNTQLVISALQKHIVVECSVANKLIDCWNANVLSQQQQEQGGGRRLGYMGHLIDILSAINSTISVSEEFRALIESSLKTSSMSLSSEHGCAEPSPENHNNLNNDNIVDKWNQILDECENELTVQKRLLADCNPNDRDDYGREGLIGYPSNPDETENDTEDFSYHFNPSIHCVMNGMNDFSDDLNEDDIESRNKFEETCNQNISDISFEPSFDNWDQQQFYNSALTLKSSPFEHDNEQDDDDFQSKDPFATSDPFESTTTSSSSNEFTSIIGNNNTSSNPMVYGYHTNGVYDQSNDFLMNYYASNYSPFASNSCNNTNILHHPPNHNSSSYSNAINSCSSSYNPFHQHFCVLSPSATNNSSCSANDNDINSNNDNWANFDSSSSDNFADFDSHFASMNLTTFSNNDDTTTTTTNEISQLHEEKKDNEKNEEEEDKQITTFVATTQVLEISSAPPTQQQSPLKFKLGPNISTSPPATVASTKALDELDDEEFFSLRDDSNEMSSLTDDNDKKYTFENTEVPEDDDDDFESADESSSKGNSEEETNSNGGDQFVDCIISTSNEDDIKLNNEEHNEKVNGVELIMDEKSKEKPIESNNETYAEVDHQSNTLDKLAQTPEDVNNEHPSLVVPPVENGSA